MLDIRIIKSPSNGTLDILKSRGGVRAVQDWNEIGAVGLVQGSLIEMLVAADVAEKAVGVMVEDIRGSCPQNMIVLAIYGDIASVENALEAIRKRLKEGT